MKIVRHVDEWQVPSGLSVGLVPTMGAFHEGHLELMRRSRRESDYTVVSLFVNPTQFAPGEDFERYPRDEARDFAMAESVGVDAIFAPSLDEMYPRKTTAVSVSGVTESYEGAIRPGHFTGVATVVLKLFNITRPDIAFFGWKDFQQCVVIRRMVEDLNVPVSLRFIETVREADGLAMSSRNAYLSAEERKIAPAFFRELSGLARTFRLAPSARFADEIRAAKDRLRDAGMSPQYLDLVDSETLEPSFDQNKSLRLLGSVRLGTTKLIDNVAV